MRRFIVLFILAAIALPAMSYASIHGVLRGKVVDSEGKGVIGASVRVEGTTLGTGIRSSNGEFTIANITAGTYRIRITAVGKAEHNVEVRITAGRTTDINVVLQDEDFRTGTVEIVAERLMVDKTAVGSQQVITNDDLQNVAREGIANVVALSAGVALEGGGFGIRGSRAGESQVRFNGLDIGSPFGGGFGAAGSYYTPIVSTYATEEVQVLKGSFSAEFGDALGGVVNTVPRTGRTDRYEGFMRYRTDVPALFGSQDKSVRVIQDGTRLKPIRAGEGLKYQGRDEHLVEFGLGGPIPIIPRSTFFLSTNYLYEKYRANNYEVRDPDGNNLGRRDNNGIWRKNITGVLSFGLTDNLRLVVGGMFGNTNWENGSWDWMYARDEGTPFPILPNGQIDYTATPVGNGVPEYLAKQNVVNTFLSNAYARINHSITSSSFYVLTVSTNHQNEQSARRKGYNSPSYFSGFDIYEPADKYVLDGDRIVLGRTDGNRIVGDKIIDLYQPITEVRASEDGYLNKDFIAKNPLTGYYEGPGNSTGSDNPYGLNNAFRTHGAGGGFEFRQNSYFQVDGNYTNIFQTGEFNHNAKAGFEIRFFEQHRHSNSMPWDGNPFFDVYSDLWGGNIYASDSLEIYNLTSKPYNPMKFSMFAQDQVSYKGIIISGGIRIDYFNPNAKYRPQTDRFVSIVQQDQFEDASSKFQISPRLNITYPITDRSNLSIAYGLYFKTPMLSNLFDSFNVDQLRGNTIMGNPNMDAEKSRQYEVAYRNQLTDDFALIITTYFKDTYNQLGIIYIPVAPVAFNMYDVTEYSNARGIEIELMKRPMNNIGLSLNYNLSYSEGTSSSPASNYNPAIDIYSGLPAFPLATYPLSNDIRHVANMNLNVFWGAKEGPSIGGIQILENTNITFTGIFRSGRPYTRLDLSQRPISETNAERGPSFWNLDARVSKGFRMRDWFGESMKNSYLEFFADIRNVLNNIGATGFYTTTNDQLDDGITLNRSIGSFTATPYYKEANYGIAATFSPEQYDSYGNRLYNEKADTDGNGIVTQVEKYNAFMKYVETNLQFLNLYNIPIRVYAGFSIRF